MKIIKTIDEIKDLSFKLRKEGKTIAFVPTMGFLHEGHLSLMKKAKELADFVIVSIFVNPTQFAPNEDFESYPRDLERDSDLAKSVGVDYIFNPKVTEMYSSKYNTSINIAGISDKFEGKTRPHHFNGVATVVAKLFNAVLPDIAVFGQKDFQQTAVVRQLVRDLNFPTKIVIAPTRRENDGLALSSRNVYLSEEHRRKAGIIFQALEDARSAVESGEQKRKIINAIMHNTLRSMQDIRIDYASSADSETLEEPEVFENGQHIVLLIACYLGKTRLIDNSLVTIPGKPQKELNEDYTDLLPKI